MIHPYRLNGYNIVLDVNSGSVHCVDDASYDIIRLFCAVIEGEGREVTEEDRAKITAQILERYPQETASSVAEVFEDIDELQRLGQLFSEDLFAPHPELLKPRAPFVKALCLHVAHTCNLSCSYCFASQGNFHGERAVMTAETARAALDFLVRESGSHYNLDVDFFGGEPLMNWDVVKETVRYGRQLEREHNKNIRFTLTTNGVGLTDEIIEFTNREMHNVVLSLDGRREVHDRFRRTMGGQGSYDIIVPKFQKLVQARDGGEYYMRGTFTHCNPDFTEDIKHMAELGFDQLSMEPVVTDPSDPLALTEADLPLLYEQYEELARWMLQRQEEGRPVTFYHYMLDLEGGPCIYKRIAGCGAGTEYYAVTPWGDLYPCHQFVGEEKFRMGNIWNGIDAAALQEAFGRNNIYAHEECADCWAKLYCSGGCAANAYHGTGSISGVYEYGCRLFRKRMECAIMMKVAETEGNGI
ncbi:MAG: thioether cross-link-forming SCIFF peptide maturase [Firmicutes bacterium]|nr:thioether cross-link-forming SCIFF peptide maturase [Bacillota bacterium]